MAHPNGRMAGPRGDRPRAIRHLGRWEERWRFWQVASGEQGALLALIGCGTLGELLCIYAVAQPLSLLSHPFPIASSEPMAAILSETVGAVRGFLLVVAAGLLLYGAAYIFARHCQGRQAFAVIFGFSALFSLTLLLTYPAGARDIFTNIVDGRMRWLYGFNPMVAAPNVIATDPLFKAMSFWQNEPSYYGPFWYLLLALPTRSVGSDLVANLIAFRALTIPFLLGSAALAARLAARRDPRLAPAAALIVGWSPLLLWECAANGHNDVVMVFFAAVALERALADRWGAALPLLAISILTKYVTLALLPLFVIVALRRHGRHALAPLARGAAIAAVASVLILVHVQDAFSGIVR